MLDRDRKVRFHPLLVTLICRPLNDTELSILEDFEYHASTCERCDIPIGTFCKAGKSLDKLLTLHFTCTGQKVHSNNSTAGPTLLEVPLQFSRSLNALKSSFSRHRKEFDSSPPPMGLVRHCVGRISAQHGVEYRFVEQYRLKRR